MSTIPGFPGGQMPPMPMGMGQMGMNPGMPPNMKGNPAMIHLWIQTFLAKINEPNPEVFANQAIEHFKNTFGG